MTNAANRTYIQQLGYQAVQVHLADENLRQPQIHTSGATYDISRSSCQRQPESTSKILRLYESSDFNPLSSEALVAQTSTRDSLTTHRSFNMPVAVDFANVKSCSSSCICSCHRPFRFASPKLLQAVIGALSITYNYSHFVNRKCDKLMCQRRSSSTARFTYIFPRWVCQRVIAINAAYIFSRGPELLLRVYRRRPLFASIFTAISYGTLKQVQDLLECDEASVLDVNDRGQSVLHVTKSVHWRCGFSDSTFSLLF